MITKEALLALQTTVNDAKTQLDQLKGQQQAYMKQLNDDWGVKTLAAGQTKLVELSNRLDIIDGKLTVGTQELVEKHNIEL